MLMSTGSPPEHDQTDPASVLPPPPSSHHASRSSTPGISSLDGTPRYLYPPPPPSPHPLPSPSRPPSVPLEPDMTIKPSPASRPGRLHHHEWLTAELIPNGHIFVPPAMHRKQPSPEASPTRTAVPDEERSPSISLPELTQLLRLQKYQKRRSHHAKERLHHLQVVAARASRLARTARTVQHTLAECIRSEDKPSFVNLLHAFQDACDLSLKPTSAAILENEPSAATDFAPTFSFLEDLSPSSRTSILDLLGKVRYSNTFLANQLVSLTHKELLSLLPDRSTPRLNESVLGSQSGLRSRSSRPLGFVVDAQVDNLSSFAYSSPLEALIFATQGVSNNGRFEDSRSTKIWATVCAKLISEQKPGSERLVPAILDVWTSMVAWPGKTRLEVWILQTLQRGAFLLEHPSKQSFRARVEGRSDISADEELRAEQFYAQATNSLLVLLGDATGPSVLPPGALKLCKALMDCLSDSLHHQKILPHYVVTRWLCSTFIIDAVTTPEAYGILADHYVSEISRQRILREVASRAQKAVFDVAYSWKTGLVVPIETTQCVNAVMARFWTFSSDTRLHSKAHKEPDNFLVLSAKDVLTSLNVLFPQRRPASVASDGDNTSSGLMSSSSSVSGFSLFRQPSESEMLVPPSAEAARDTDSLQLSHAETESDGDVMDASQMREVYLELEDVVSSHSTAASNLWDVLYARSGTEYLETMRYAFHDQRFDGYTETPVACGRWNLPKDHVVRMMSCAKGVESLLREHESQYSFPVENYCSDESLQEADSVLTSLFEQSISECEARADFVQAHHWYKRLQDFRDYLACSHDSTAISDLLDHVEHSARISLDRTESSLEACESWAKHFGTTSQVRKAQLNPILEEHERLRDKLWYVADVRTSAAFEEARSVAAALRIMGKTKKLPRTRLQPPLRHWNGSKLSGSSKTEAQILEILSARPEHGGPNKLSDDQSKAIELWMDRQNIDNICRGEERLHKLCMEVRKCVDSIMSAPNESSTIWSNPLFSQDIAIRAQMPPQKKNTLLQGPLFGTGQHNYLSLQTHLRSNDALSITSRTLSSVSSRDFLDARSPTLTNKSSLPFWSPVMTEVDSPSSATSVDMSRTQSAFDASPHKTVRGVEVASEAKLDTLRQRALSLVLSDLTSVLFSDGSETDRAFWSGLGWTLTDRYFRGMHALHSSIGSPTPTTTIASTPPVSAMHFKFETAFSTLLQKFSATSNPHTKLVCLYDIDRLLTPYMAEQNDAESPMTSFVRSAEGSPLATMSKTPDAADISVRGFRHIFSKNSLRPSTIFRDLQYIAALLPSPVLQNTPEGKAFCNAAVAISGLKHEARSIMVETADGIIAYHSNNRGHGRSSSTAQQQRDSATFATPSRTPSAEDVSRYSMGDAAYLLQITAKEGDSVAQRELATLYLTHPELMDPIIAPLARPRDVFKDELESKWRKNQDPNRCDPATMCVAHHWMSLSSKGGDSLAKEYLRQREMDSF